MVTSTIKKTATETTIAVFTHFVRREDEFFIKLFYFTLSTIALNASG